MNKKFFWMLILCFSLLISSMVGCVPQDGSASVHSTTISTDSPIVKFPYEIDWNMNATLIRENGTVVDTFSLPVIGTIKQSSSDSRYWFDLDVELPKSVPYIMWTPDSGETPVETEILEREGDWVATHYCYDVNNNAPHLNMWGINLEKQYFITYWGQDYGHFVVASLDPNIKPEKITEHFDYLMDLMKQFFEDL